MSLLPHFKMQSCARYGSIINLDYSPDDTAAAVSFGWYRLVKPTITMSLRVSLELRCYSGWRLETPYNTASTKFFFRGAFRGLLDKMRLARAGSGRFYIETIEV